MANGLVEGSARVEVLTRSFCGGGDWDLNLRPLRSELTGRGLIRHARSPMPCLTCAGSRRSLALRSPVLRCPTRRGWSWLPIWLPLFCIMLIRFRAVVVPGKASCELPRHLRAVIGGRAGVGRSGSPRWARSWPGCPGGCAYASPASSSWPPARRGGGVRVGEAHRVSDAGGALDSDGATWTIEAEGARLVVASMPVARGAVDTK